MLKVRRWESLFFPCSYLKVLKYFGETLEELGDLPGAVEKYEEAMTAKCHFCVYLLVLEFVASISRGCFEDVRLAGRGMQTGLLCLWNVYRTRPAISFFHAPLLFWHNLFLRQAKAIREDPLLVHWRYQKPSTPNIIHMVTRYYSGIYRVSKQKSTRDSRSTSCKQLMKNEQSHLESNTSGIFRIVINATWSNMLDNRQTAGAQGEQHFRHSRRWTSDVEFGPGLFWQAGLVCAKYFVFLATHVHYSTHRHFDLWEYFQWASCPMQGWFGPRSRELPSGSGKNIKATADCGSGQTRQHVWTSGSFGESCVLLPLPFSGGSPGLWRICCSDDGEIFFSFLSR